MKRRNLTRRLDELDGGRGAVFVTLKIEGYTTQADYDRAFWQAWEQVPAGAVVFCFPKLDDLTWWQECERYCQGLPPLIDHRCGIYLKDLEAQ